MDIQIIEDTNPKSEKVKIEYRMPSKPKTYEIEENEVSKNIQKFDQKVAHKVYKENPYGFNAVAKKRVDVPPTQTASQMIANPMYNIAGKFLGVDTVHDWNQKYDKVFTVVEWARSQAKTDKMEQLMRWISNKSKSVPSVGNNRLDDLYLFAKMYFAK